MSFPIQERLDDPTVPAMALVARTIWFGLCAMIVFVCLYDGAGYAYGGANLAVGPAFQELRDWPGIRAHGFILLALACALIFSVGRRTPFWSLVAVTGYSALVTFQFFAAWVTTGQIVWSSPSKWLFLMLPGSLLLAVTFVRSHGAVLSPRRRAVSPEPTRGSAGAA